MIYSLLRNARDAPTSKIIKEAIFTFVVFFI